MKNKINILLVGAVTFVWASIFWLGDNNLWQAERSASLELYKPWVYRQLVPMLARLLESIGIRIDLAIVLIVTASGIGLYLALRSLVNHYYPDNDALVVCSVFAGLLMFGYARLQYDLTTAWLWTLALLYIAKEETYNYLMLFPLICLNRETAFLLIIIYTIHKPHDISETAYQIGVYALVAVALRVMFADNGGVESWVEPLQNIQRFINHPVQTLLHIATAGVMLWIAAKGWQQKPAFLRLAFLVLAPALTAAYIIAGQSFEVRVFWELFPVVVLLALPTITDRIQWLNPSISTITKIKATGS